MPCEHGIYLFLLTTLLKNRKKNLLKLAALAVASAVMLPAIAEDNKTGSGPNPFSDCGIGAALFKDTSWAAVTSNVIWDLGTTAVTSATMSPATCNKQNVKAALFIRDTYVQIAEDAARGNGDHLATVLEILECGSSQQAAAAAQVRAGMTEAVAAPNYNDQQHLEKAGQMFNIIHGAAASCRA